MHVEKFGYDSLGLYEPEAKKSVSDSAVWLSILTVVLVVFAWYGIKIGWFAGQANLKGFVVDNYSHAFSSSTVALLDKSGNEAYSAGLDAEGKFEFENIRPGKYLISLNTDYGKYPGVLDVFIKRNCTAEYKVIVEQSWFSQRKQAALMAEKRAETEKKRQEDRGSCSTGGGGG